MRLNLTTDTRAAVVWGILINRAERGHAACDETAKSPVMALWRTRSWSWGKHHFDRHNNTGLMCVGNTRNSVIRITG